MHDVNEKYNGAKQEAAAYAYGALGELAVTIDQMRKQLHNQPDVVNEFILAYAHRLEEKAQAAHHSVHDGVAYIKHFGVLHERLVTLFDKVAGEIVGQTPHDQQMRDMIKATRDKVGIMDGVVSEFFNTYAYEITREDMQLSAARDRKIIKSVESEMRQAVTLGAWEPELSPVGQQHVEGGEPLLVESVSSRKMSSLADKAGPLRNLGLCG